MIRKLAITAALILALGAGADFGVRLYSERVVADQLQSSLGLPSRPAVSFGGWPFIPHALSGDLPSATLSATDLQKQGVRLSQVSLTLRDLTFSSHRLIAKGAGRIRVKSGTASAVLTAADLNATLKSEGLPLSITIKDGDAFAKFAGASSKVDITLDGDTLVLAPRAAGGAATARIGLPVPIRGMGYTKVRLNADEIVLSATLKNALIVLPG